MAVSKRIVPVVGGVTAAATAVGAFAPAAQVASAAPETVDSTAGAGGVLGLAQEGVFESCSAYFGFGKEEGAINATTFDVTDVKGDDEGGHSVPADVDVVLVIENEEGDILECVPEEITEEEWNARKDHVALGVPFRDFPEWPGPGYFAYPSVQQDGGAEEDEKKLAAAAIDGFGFVRSVGFRVIGVPEGHTLVAPSGFQPLPDHFEGRLFPFDSSFYDDVLEPEILSLAEAGAGAEAAAALAEAFESCIAEEDIGGSDPLLLAAVQAIADALVESDYEFVEVDCWAIAQIENTFNFLKALQDAATHVEGISLAGPVATPAPGPAPAPAAQPAVAAPTFTG